LFAFAFQVFKLFSSVAGIGISRSFLGWQACYLMAGAVGADDLLFCCSLHYERKREFLA
jgi:hypothetical protein